MKQEGPNSRFFDNPEIPGIALGERLGEHLGEHDRVRVVRGGRQNSNSLDGDTRSVRPTNDIL